MARALTREGIDYFQQDNALSTRIEGRCIKYYMGAVGVKVYDKFSSVLRIETTVNDVSFFKHHRKVEHKYGHVTRELAPLEKTIFSLVDLREILLACNQRYLAFLSSLDDPRAGERDLQRLSQPRIGNVPSVKGLLLQNRLRNRFAFVDPVGHEGLERDGDLVRQVRNGVGVADLRRGEFARHNA